MDVRYRAFATDVLPFSIGWMLHLGVLRSSIRHVKQRNATDKERCGPRTLVRDYGTPVAVKCTSRRGVAPDADAAAIASRVHTQPPWMLELRFNLVRARAALRSVLQSA